MKVLPTLIFSLFLGATVLTAGAADTHQSVDSVLKREADLTGDGIPENISVHLQGRDMQAPFTWVLMITSGQTEIFRYASDDTWLNEHFGDEGYVLDCKGYLECKRKYYFHDLIDGLVLSGGSSYDPDGVTDRAYPNTLYPLGKKQLKECCSINELKAEPILGKVEKRLRDKTAVILDVPVSPVQSNPPLVFVPDVGRFIVFYED